MAKRGGSSTIAGIEYQSWVVAYKIVDVLLGDAICIVPEAQTSYDPEKNTIEIVSIDDLIVRTNQQKLEFYSIKSHATEGKEWTSDALKKAKVFSQFAEQNKVHSTNKMFLVSASACPLFSEVLPRGAVCKNRDDIVIRLTANNYMEDWDNLKNILGFTNENLMIEFAKKVEMKTWDGSEIEKWIIDRLRGYVTQREKAPTFLYRLAQEAGKSGKEVDRAYIKEYLLDKGISIMSRLEPELILNKMLMISSCINNTNSTIGGKYHIERKVVQEIVDCATLSGEKKEDRMLIVTGEAGTGKSVVLKDVTHKLVSLNIPTLTLTADTYSQIKTEVAFCQELDLKDGICESLATLTELYNKVVVIIDQLDSISLSLSKDRSCLNTFINLIHKISSNVKIYIIICCRKFDLEFDPLIRNAFSKKTNRIIGVLERQDLLEAFKGIGVDTNRIDPKLFELLLTPLHLDIFSKIYSPVLALGGIKTLQDLYTEFWNQKILPLPDAGALSLIKDIAREMEKNSDLSIKSSHFDDRRFSLNLLLSNSIIREANHKIQFFHQSFFDYCFVSDFIEHNNSIHKWLLKNHQGLFIRSQLKQLLNHARANSPNMYAQDLEIILTSKRIRKHLKVLALDVLGSVIDPTPKEKNIIEHLKQQFMVKAFLESIKSEKWLMYAWNNSLLQNFLQNPKYWYVVSGVFRSLINIHTEIVIKMLESISSDTTNYEEIVTTALFELRNWHIKEACDFFKAHRLLIKESKCHFYGNIIRGIAIKEPKEVFDIFFSDLEIKLNDIINTTKDIHNFPEHSDLEIIELLFKWNVHNSASQVFKIIVTLINATRFEMNPNLSFFEDRAFYSYNNFENDLYNLWKLLTIFQKALNHVAINEPQILEDLTKDKMNSFSMTLLSIIAEAYVQNIPYFKTHILTLIKREFILWHSDNWLHSSFKQFLSTEYANFQFSEKKELLGIIKSILPDWEKPQKSSFRGLNYIGITRYRFLKCIPEEFIKRQDIQLWRDYNECERRFANKYDNRSNPNTGTFGAVGSPIEKEALLKMTKEQWLIAFKKYDENTSWFSPNRNALKGGIIELARSFQAEIKRQPANYYDFIDRLCDMDEIPAAYLEHAIRGLVEANYDPQKVNFIIEKSYEKENHDLRREVVRAIEYLDKQGLRNEQYLNILDNYYEDDKDKSSEQKTSNPNIRDLITAGFGSIRGSVAWAVGVLSYNSTFSERLFTIADKIANDQADSVKACLITHLQGLIHFDRERTRALFFKLIEGNNTSVLVHGLQCLFHLTDQNYIGHTLMLLKIAASTIESKEDYYVTEIIGNHLAIHWLNGYFKFSLLNKIRAYCLINSSKEIIINIIKTITYNLVHKDKNIQTKARKIYRHFSRSKDSSILKSYDGVFSDIKAEDFMRLLPVINKYSTSRAFSYASHFFLSYIEKAVIYNPLECYTLIHRYFKRSRPLEEYSERDLAVNILIGIYGKLANLSDKDKVINLLDDILIDDRTAWQGKRVLLSVDRA